MHRTSIHKWALVAISSASLAFLGGCFLDGSSSDDSSAEVAEILDEITDGVASSASQSLEEDLGNFIRWVDGGVHPAPAREQTITWDAENGSWVLVGNTAYEDTDANGTITYEIHVRFSDAGTAQEQPNDLTDRVDVSRSAHNAGNYHPADRGFDIDYEWQEQSELLVLRNEETDFLTITGGGTLEGNTQAHRGARTYSHEQHATWEFELGWQRETTTCPTGSLAGTFNDAFEFTASHDGTGTVSWEIRRDDSLVRSGTDTVQCTNSGA